MSSYLEILRTLHRLYEKDMGKQSCLSPFYSNFLKRLDRRFFFFSETELQCSLFYMVLKV